MLICKYCEREYKNKNSLVQHEIRCKENPNRIDLSYIKHGHSKGHIGKNQFTKAKELGLEIPKVSEETKQKIGKARRGKKHTIEQINKIKNGMKSAVIKYPESYRGINYNGKVKKYKYNDYTLDGKWEVSFAKYLDANNIKWIRPNKGISYIWNNEQHKYFPDFYLIEYNMYVEIKGYQTERDLCKWKEVDNLLVLFKNDINEIRNNIFNLNEKISHKELHRQEIP